MAERRREALGTDEDGLIEAYRTELAKWAQREAAEDQPYKPEALWDLQRLRRHLFTEK